MRNILDFAHIVGRARTMKGDSLTFRRDWHSFSTLSMLRSYAFCSPTLLHSLFSHFIRCGSLAVCHIDTTQSKLSAFSNGAWVKNADTVCRKHSLATRTHNATLGLCLNECVQYAVCCGMLRIVHWAWVCFVDEKRKWIERVFQFGCGSIFRTAKYGWVFEIKICYCYRKRNHAFCDIFAMCNCILE